MQHALKLPPCVYLYKVLQERVTLLDSKGIPMIALLIVGCTMLQASGQVEGRASEVHNTVYLLF